MSTTDGGFWDFFSSIFPNIWRARRERKRIKIKHLKNIQSLQNGNVMDIDFNDCDESCLLFLSETAHTEVISDAQNNGLVSVGECRIPREKHQEAIKSKTKTVVRRIRVENILVLALWFIFALATFSLALGIASGIFWEVLASFLSAS